MLGRAIDASLPGYVDDIAVRGAWSGRGRARHDDHASADLLGAGGIHLDVMHAPVHSIDHQMNSLAHLVAAKPLVEHAACDALGDVFAVQDVAGGMAVLRQPFALQSPVHGLDGVATFAALPQRRLGLWRYNPFAGLNLTRQPHTSQLARTLDQESAILTEGVAHVLVGAQVGKLPPLLLCDQHPVESGEAIGIYFPLKLLRDLQLVLPAQFPRHDLAGPLPNTVGDIVAGDVEGLAVLSDAAQEDMGVRVSCVVVIDRWRAQFGPSLWHDLHQPHRALFDRAHCSTLHLARMTARIWCSGAPERLDASVTNVANGRTDRPPYSQQLLLGVCCAARQNRCRQDHDDARHQPERS